MAAPTRRYVLGCIAGASALAGCANSSTSSIRFDQVTTDGTSLIIELETTEGVEELSVIDPDGAAFSTVDATAGQTRYTIELGTRYTPGEYEINAVVDKEVAATTTTTLRPDVEITDVGVGENYPAQMPDSLGQTKNVECYVDVQNTGSGPTAIQKLSFDGDVPNPTKKDESSGIYDSNSGGGEVEQITIEPEKQKRIFSSTLPFSFEGSGVDCESEPKSGEAIVRVGLSNRSETTATYEVKYTGSDSYDGCTPKIEGSG
jgi:hypothetical protein